jgi:dihydrofolate reductase
MCTRLRFGETFEERGPMGKVVVTAFMSLDGVMEAPGGEPDYKHAGWVLRRADAGQGQYKLDEVLSHEALLLGRRTYESFAGAWPSRKGPFADKMNGMPKYVVSTTLERAEWNNSAVIGSDVPGAVARLKKELGGDLLVAGSRTLVGALRRHDLIDEYRLMIFPVVLGSGRRLFDESPDATPLELVDLRRFESGAVVLTYRPTRTAEGS